jgi:hypothetical protein
VGLDESQKKTDANDAKNGHSKEEEKKVKPE